MRIDRTKLVAEMTRQDLLVKDLVEKTGLSRATISGIKAGKSCLEETAKIIADALKVSLEELR